MITISDVAKKAGVSIGTVSNVINKRGNVKKETEEVILKAISELGYIPNSMAQGLKTKQSNIIGVMVEDIRAFLSPDIIDGICDFAEQHNYTINLCNLRVDQSVNSISSQEYKNLLESEHFKNSIHSNLNLLMTARASGLIYVAEFPRDISGVLPEMDIPVVYTYSYTNNDMDYSVNYDDYHGALKAVEYIISQGHEKIAVISGSINTTPTYKRMQGYQDALMQHGITYRPDFIKTTNWQYKDAYEECSTLLEQADIPTVIFVMSDLMGYAVINAIRDHGLRVPEDISVHGFDDLEFSNYVSPKLTTVRLPLFDIGRKACEMVTQLIEHKEPTEKQVLLKCSHIIRESVKKLNHN